MRSACALLPGDVVALSQVEHSLRTGSPAKLVLHGWDDDQARLMLQAVRTAMTPVSRLLVIEAVIGEGDQPDPGKLVDLRMLVLFAGREHPSDGACSAGFVTCAPPPSTSRPAGTPSRSSGRSWPE